MTSSESEGQAPSRKRARKSSKADDSVEGSTKEGKKTRGRPRVDTQDATAADRRRTQIRLAQRAYRQRKETTIVSLKQQSTQLHSIIEQMNSTFAGFAESALKSGLLQLNANLARELKHANETFNALSKAAADLERVDDENGEVPEQAEETAVAQPSQNQPSPVGEPRDIGLGYTAMDYPTQRPSPPQISAQPNNYFTNPRGNFGQADSTDIISRRQYTVGDVLDQSRSSYSETTQPQQPPLPFGFVDMLNQPQASFPPPNPQIYSVDIPTPDVTPPMTRLHTPPLLKLPNPITNKTLAPIFTYSHEETTFARRLTRAALETGFHLLSTASIRPSALNFVFKLSLPYLSLDQLRTRFKIMLSRGVDEDLDFWEQPFIHLGGAGTHYPRKDANGNLVYKKNSWTVRQIGPLEKRMVRLECIDDGRWQQIEGIDLSGFEGEWYDAYDVQGYLEQRYSCKIDPKTSFAECLVDEEDDPSPEHEPGWKSPESHASLDTFFPPQLDPIRPELSKPPSLTHSSSTSSSSASSTQSTPPTNGYNPPEGPFGLDMFNNAPTYPSNNTEFSKSNNINLSFDQTLGLDLAPGFDYGYPVVTNFAGGMNLGLNMMDQLPVVRQKRMAHAWVETSKLIDELIKHAVCLGRAPGFRRKDVDMALRKALVTPF